MSCCENELNCSKEKALSLGLDPDWVATLIELYGAEVLKVVVEVVRQGMSATLVLELLRTYGPRILMFLLNIFQNKNVSSSSASEPALSDEETLKVVLEAAKVFEK